MTPATIPLRRRRAVVSLLLALACSTPVLAVEPFYEGLGSYTRPVTTNSPEAARYFNQGLAFIHGFNHSAAIRSFQEAIRLDPTFAMAHWGIAYANGPHINFPAVPPPAAEAAWKELQLAQQNAAHASPVEQDLIEALSHRYANPQPEDRHPLDEAYAEAMRKVWQKHPDDPDVGAFFAESLMDLRPWNQWTPEGQPNPGTEEVIATLDAVLKLNINHPFANHLYIHAVEASPHPERADAPADRLRDLQPGIAHNVHMPSHIDIRRGRWQQAITANEKAIAADQNYRQIAGPPKGFINLYIAHNQHMLAYAAMMTGQRELAMKHIRAMTAGLPEDFIKDFAPHVESFQAMPLEVMVRFGQWDSILAEPDVTDGKDYMPFTRAFRHAARAIAYAAKNDTASARAEQKACLDLSKTIPKEEYVAGQNLASDVCAVITPMLEGEILLREGKTDAGLDQLRTAVKAEDALHYEEPPGWLIPVRHSLGAALLQANQPAEAEAVYREDLKRLPDNGWSLYGLSDALRRQNKVTEADAAATRFQTIWSNADTEIHSSCLCRPTGT